MTTVVERSVFDFWDIIRPSVSTKHISRISIFVDLRLSQFCDILIIRQREKKKTYPSYTRVSDSLSLPWMALYIRPLRLFTFGSFLKIMANRVFSHAFEHPEFSAGQKSCFWARLVVANFVWNYKITIGDQKIKFLFSFQFGVSHMHLDARAPNLVSEL